MKKHLAYRVGVGLLVLIGLLAGAVAVWGQGEETATVVAIRAPLHVEPSAQSEITVTLSRGTLLIFLGLDESLSWAEVKTPEDVIGWVSVVYLRLNGPYVPPPDGITRTVVDGKADDWERFTRPFADEAGDTTGNVDILAARSFMNDNYLYVLIEATGDLRQARLVLVDIVTHRDDEYFTYQYALPRRQAGTLFIVTEEQGESRDASGVVAARDEAIEFRMPLDLIDRPDTFNLVSVQVQELTADGLATTDALQEVMPTVVTLETEPVPDSTITGARVNLRAAPVNGRVLRVLVPGEPLSLMGRSRNRAWLFVRLEDTVQGWVAAEFVQTDAEIAALPVVE